MKAYIGQMEVQTELLSIEREITTFVSSHTHVALLSQDAPNAISNAVLGHQRGHESIM